MDTTGLIKNDANYVPLSPISFLQTSARTYPHKTAVIYGDRQYSWQDFYHRCAQLAAALEKNGIGDSDVVSYVASNTPELLEAHFGVAMAGAVLNTINTRLDATTLRYIFKHAESKIIFVDREFSEKVATAIADIDPKPTIIDINDYQWQGHIGPAIGECDYDTFLAQAKGRLLCQLPSDEWNPISVNYTSGTTGHPKGVVYHHRGAYLMAMGSATSWDMRKHGVHLCTVPMFHCNGWGYPWTQALLTGVSICIRTITGDNIFNLIDKHQVQTMGGAPVVHSFIAEAGRNKRLTHPVKILIAGAPPTTSILEKMEEIGFLVTHVYGLTETYGHTIICAYQDEWDSLPIDKRADMKSRQGVGFTILQNWAILDKNNQPLPADGKNMGEIGLRGNTIMSGYLKNPEATKEVFANGWFKTGDIGIQHEDGYLKVTDRIKDIIISGGENISSITIENVLSKHPDILLAAVVARPDEKWGETPCAFIEKRQYANCDEKSIIEFCRENLPSFMSPKTVIFCELPKTATGKIKKYELREKAKNLK